jgi:IS5 family transposase
VESNIHYPTDSSLLNDGARVLTRTMQKIEQKAGGLKRRIRNRMRSVTKRVITIAHALRHKGPEGEEKRKAEYGQLLHTTRQILNDAKRVLSEVDVLPRRRKSRVRKLREELETMADRVRSVVRQTKGRIFGGLASAKNHAEPLLPPARRRLSTQVLRARKNRTGNA